MKADAIKWLKKHIAALEQIRDELTRHGVDVGKMTTAAINTTRLAYHCQETVTADDSPAYKLYLGCSLVNSFTLSNRLIIIFDPTWNGVQLVNELDDELNESWCLRCFYDCFGKSQGHRQPLPQVLQNAFKLKDQESRKLTREQGVEAVRSFAEFFLRVQTSAVA